MRAWLAARCACGSSPCCKHALASACCNCAECARLECRVWQGVVHVLLKSVPDTSEDVKDAFVKLLARALNYVLPLGKTPGSTPAIRARQRRPDMLGLGS